MSGPSPENAEAGLGVVEGDPLDEAGKNLLGRWFKIGLHADAGSSVLSTDGTSVEPTGREFVGQDNGRMALNAERELTQ